MQVSLFQVPLRRDAPLIMEKMEHWAVKVGTRYYYVTDGYEFTRYNKRKWRYRESEEKEHCEHLSGKGGTQLRLGSTRKRSEDIVKWRNDWIRRNSTTGEDKICQDFAVEFCEFLGVDTEKLPWRQARKQEAVAAVGVTAITAVVALAGGYISTMTSGLPAEEGNQKMIINCRSHKVNVMSFKSNDWFQAVSYMWFELAPNERRLITSGEAPYVRFHVAIEPSGCMNFWSKTWHVLVAPGGQPLESRE